MKALMFTLLFGGYFTPSNAQTNRSWNHLECLHKPHDQPDIKHLSDFFFANKSTGWAISNDGQVYKTTNGGKNWTTPCQPLSIAHGHLYFMDEKHGWLWNQNGQIFHTHNGGSTWRILTTGEQINIHDLHFVNLNTGFITNIEGVFVTHNAGRTWQLLSDYTGEGYSDIQFADPMNGKILHYFGLLTTSDGGKSWRYDPVFNQNDVYAHAFSFLDKHRGIIAGMHPELLMLTQDGGKTWEQLPGIHHSLGNSHHGEHDPYEEDGPEITMIRYVNDSTITAVNSSGEVLMSYNKGRTWQKAPLPYGVIASETIQFTSQSEGIFYYFGGHEFFTTSNAGKSWQSIKDKYNQHLNDLYFVNKHIGYCVGNRGSILKTTKGGKEWKLIETPITSNLNRVLFLNENTGWLLGDEGDVYYTSNGGNSWSKQWLPVTIYHSKDSIERLDPSMHHLCPKANVQPLSDHSCFPHHLEHIHMFNDREGWIQGRVLPPHIAPYITLYQTHDGGKTWKQIPTYTSNKIVDYVMLTPSSLYAITPQRLMVSTDAGNSWRSQKMANYCNSGPYRRLYPVNDTMLTLIAQSVVIAVPLSSGNGLGAKGRHDFHYRELKKNSAHFFLEPNTAPFMDKHRWSDAFIIGNQHVYSAKSFCFGAVSPERNYPLSNPLRGLFLLDNETIYMVGANGFIGRVSRRNKADTPARSTSSKGNKKGQEKTIQDSIRHIIVNRNSIKFY
jgi:photosystem II stability/assembly factor-like uncharacterized protein